MKASLLTATAVFLLAASPRPLDAAAPNLLANGTFENGLAGWARAQNVDWTPAFGGSARIDQSSSSGFEALLQCVPVEGDAVYRASATANLPQRVDGDGGLAVRVRWFEAAGCQGAVLGGAPSLDFETSAETRQTKARVLVSPPGARSAIVQLVARADTSATYAFLVDDVTFAPEFVGEILTLPTAASAPGARGQRFVTDLWIRNTSPSFRRFSLRIACPPPCGQNPEWVILNLGPLETRAIPDVIADFLGGGRISGKAGAIEIQYDPRDGEIEVFARVATANEDRPGNGTVIPARTRGDARARADFIGLAGLGGEAGFRVNAGAFNPEDRATVVTFIVRDAAGNELGSVERTWGPREWFQINNVLAAAGAPSDRAASIHVEAGPPLFPFAIAIDNRSGDPTWLEPAPVPIRH